MSQEHNIIFATRSGEGENEYISTSEIEISKVADLEVGEERPINSGKNFVDYSVLEWRLKGLTGRVLTAVDAAIPQGPQNKATKDIIRSAIMDEFMYFGEICFDQEELCKQANESFDEKTAKPVSFEEILGN